MRLINKEISIFEDRDVERDRKRKDRLQNLEQEAALLKAHVHDYERRQGDFRGTLESLGDPIRDLFFNLRCNSMFTKDDPSLLSQGAYQDLVDNASVISSSSIQRYLGVIEQRGLELMQVRHHQIILQSQPADCPSTIGVCFTE